MRSGQKIQRQIRVLVLCLGALVVGLGPNAQAADRMAASDVERVFVNRSLDPAGNRALDRQVVRDRLSARLQEAHDEKQATSSRFEREVKPAAKPIIRAQKTKALSRRFSISRGFAPAKSRGRALEIERDETTIGMGIDTETSEAAAATASAEDLSAQLRQGLRSSSANGGARVVLDSQE